MCLSCLYSGLYCIYSDLSCLCRDLIGLFRDIPCLYGDLSCLYSGLSCSYMELSSLNSGMSCFYRDLQCILSDISCLYRDIHAYLMTSHVSITAYQASMMLSMWIFQALIVIYKPLIEPRRTIDSSLSGFYNGLFIWISISYSNQVWYPYNNSDLLRLHGYLLCRFCKLQN